MPGIFQTLKSREHPLVLKELNAHLKFSARFAEAKMLACCIQDSIDRNEYPKTYWKSIRRCHAKPTVRTLKRHALNLLETTQSNITGMDRLALHTARVV